MTMVCNEDKCTGCMACLSVCPKDAITIKDSVMQYNAVIDLDKCVGCDACHAVCQQNNPPVLSEPITWYQGWARDETIRSKGSSGGFAGAISKKFIENGGEVYSCVFESGDFIFRCASTVDELHRFAGSKYVKSNPESIYREIKSKLCDGNKILFIGLPCQVGALKNYVRNSNTDLLYTIDLICHGTPSPKLLEIFLNQYEYSLKSVKNIAFRNKERFQVCEGYKGIITNGVGDRYTMAFLHSLSYTENCYECKYARKRRVSDITLGDSWGSDIGGEEHAKGISLALCMTKKGDELVKNSNLHLEMVDLEKAIASNHQLQYASIKPKAYDSFCEGIKEGKNFNRLVTKSLPKVCFKQDIKRLLIKLHVIHVGGGKLSYGIAVLPSTNVMDNGR